MKSVENHLYVWLLLLSSTVDTFGLRFTGRGIVEVLCWQGGPGIRLEERRESVCGEKSF